MLDPLNLFKLADFLICLVSAVALYRIYIRVQKNLSKNDKGYQYLSLGFFTWVSSLVLWFLSTDTPPWINAGLSVLNSGLFLCSISYFNFSPKWIQFGRPKVSPTVWTSRVVKWCVLVAILLVILSVANSPYAPWPDILLSLMTLILLTGTFFNSFWERGLRGLAYLCALMCACVIIAQIPIVLVGWIDNENSNLIQQPTIATIKGWVSRHANGDDSLNPLRHLAAVFNLLTHFSLIILSIIAALVWVKWHLKPEVMTDAENLKLEFKPITEKKFIVNIYVDETLPYKDVPFSAALYLCLLASAVYKKCKNTPPPPLGTFISAQNMTRIKEKVWEYRSGNHKLIKNKGTKGKKGETLEHDVEQSWPNFFTKEGLLRHFPENIIIPEQVISSLSDKNPLFEGRTGLEEIKSVYFQYLNGTSSTDASITD